jgi:hypothetical protein
VSEGIRFHFPHDFARCASTVISRIPGSFLLTYSVISRPLAMLDGVTAETGITQRYARTVGHPQQDRSCASLPHPGIEHCVVQVGFRPFQLQILTDKRGPRFVRCVNLSNYLLANCLVLTCSPSSHSADRMISRSIKKPTQYAVAMRQSSLAKSASPSCSSVAHRVRWPRILVRRILAKYMLGFDRIGGL